MYVWILVYLARMARGRGPGTDNEDVEAADAAAAAEFEAAQEPADALRSLSDQFGNLDGFGIRAYRYERNGTQEGWAFLGRFPAAEFELDTFSTRYGAGRYKFQIAGAGGRCIKTFSQLIGGPAPAAAQPVAAAPLNAPRVSEASDDSLLKTILLHSMKTQGDILVALVGGLSRAGNGGGMTAADMLAAFRVGQESAGATRQPFEPVLEAVKAGMDIAAGRNSADDGGSPLKGLVSQVMPLLEHLLSRQPAQPITVSGQPASVPGGVEPGPAAPPARGVAFHPLMRLAQQYAPVLLKEARRGHDPILFGQFIAERCPDSLVDALHKLASAQVSERMAVLSQINPELAQFTPWIDQVCEGILQVIDGGDQETGGDAGGGQVRTDPDPGGRAGNLAERGSDPAGGPGGVGAAGGPSVRGTDRAGEPT